MKRKIVGSKFSNVKYNGKCNWNKKYNVVAYFKERNGEKVSKAEAISILEDNGLAVADPPTLKSACEVYLDYSEDVDEALQAIEYDFGNGVGVFPLNIFSYHDQQAIYENFIYEFHPEYAGEY